MIAQWELAAAAPCGCSSWYRLGEARPTAPGEWTIDVAIERRSCPTHSGPDGDGGERAPVALAA